MNAKKSTKIIALVVAAILLVGIGIGCYFIFRPKTPPDNSELEIGDDNLVLVNGGTYQMGSPASERLRGSDETQHSVTVSSFYVDPYEVTQKDYQSVMGANPSHFSGDYLPVENITWYQAIEYCNKLSESRNLTPAYTVSGTTVTWNRAANGYRLLTEAEWEYAARGGTTTTFPTGGFMHTDDANYYGSYPYLIEQYYTGGGSPSGISKYRGTYRGTTIRVDSLGANAFGLFNMYGNVAEWCFDWYGAYDTANTNNPTGVASGSLRVNRGGSYNDFCKHLRSAYRSATNPLDIDQNLGFRICRNAEAGEGSFTTTYSLNISIPQNPKILVAYFSYSGNTERAARMIAEKTGGDLVELEMQHPYSGNIYSVSARDLYDDARPALKNQIDMSQYDVVLLGYPTWWATMPMPIYTFLESYDFTGKTVINFSSHGSGMFGESVSDLSKTIPTAYVGFGYEFTYSSSSSSAIDNWLALNRLK